MKNECHEEYYQLEIMLSAIHCSYSEFMSVFEDVPFSNFSFIFHLIVFFPSRDGIESLRHEISEKK